jgi:pimeloyl-ACP methyl ester carboxylesterase
MKICAPRLRLGHVVAHLVGGTVLLLILLATAGPPSLLAAPAPVAPAPPAPAPATTIDSLTAASTPARPQPRTQPALAVEGSVQGRCDCEIVLVHGLGSSAAVWDELLPYLRGCEVWTYELPGHGGTPPQPGLTMSAAAEDLARFIAEHDIVYPSLVGHAMGGVIAMRYALDHPGDVKRLVVIDAAPKQLATPEQKVQITDGLTKDYDRFLARMFLNMSPRKDVTERVLDQALRTDSASFITLLMSSFDFDLTPDLPGLTPPLLVIGSQLFFPDEDNVRSELDQLGFMKAPTVKFKRLAKIGHFPMLEQPAYLASVIRAFILLAG